MLLREAYPHKHPRAGKGGEPLLCPGEERPPSLWQGRNVAGCRPLTTTIWVTLGMEGMLFPGVGSSRPLPQALSVLECSSLCSCPEDSPRLCLAGTC